MKKYKRNGLKWIFNTALYIFCVSIGSSLPCHGENIYGLSEKESVVVCTSSTILSLDPTNHRDRDTQMVIKNMFDSLTTRDKNLRVVPQLAESWESVDQTTWEFKLKKHVKFHNGVDFTAKDVKFTIDRVIKERAIDGKTSPRKSLFERITEVKVIDRFLVRIITDKPWPILPLMLTLQEIIPKKYMQKVGSQGFEKKPIGAGPFRFIEKKTNGTLILKRFKDYYGGSVDNPPVQVAPLKYLIFKTVPDQALRTAMLKNGLADIITNVPLEITVMLDRTADISVVGNPATRSYFADLNCKKFPFNDRKIRIAANYAIDMRIFLNTLLQGKGTILPTILLPKAFGNNSMLMPYPYNPEGAKELLRQAKFPKNYKVKIVCIEKYSSFANFISLFLSKVGMQSSITIEEKPVVRAAMKNLNADILVTSWGNTTLDPVGILLPKLKSNGRGNFSNYSNEKVDRLLLSAETTLVSDERDAYYKEVQEIIYEDAPMIFGYASDEFYGVRNHVKGFIPSSTGMNNFHDVYKE